jgi:hypothetical protein
MTATIFATISALQVVSLGENHKAIFHIVIYGLVFGIALRFILVHAAN